MALRAATRTLIGFFILVVPGTFTVAATYLNANESSILKMMLTRVKLSEEERTACDTLIKNDPLADSERQVLETLLSTSPAGRLLPQEVLALQSGLDQAPPLPRPKMRGTKAKDLAWILYGEGAALKGEGAALKGVADLWRAYGDLANSLQEARLKGQQVESAKLDLRMKRLQQWLWERANLPTSQDERERVLREELRRAQNDPPLTEIWTAKSLNTLLTHVQTLQARRLEGPSIPLRNDVVKRINVQAGGRPTNMGILKESQLDWPQALQVLEPEAEARSLRSLLAAQFKQCRAQAAQRKVDARQLQDLEQSVDRFRALLTRQAAKLKPTQYIEAKRYLDDLEQGIKALGQPEAKHYLTGKYSAKGKNVRDLVQNMTDQGLQFGPATSGDQAAYLALHRALVSYGIGVYTFQQVTKAGLPSPTTSPGTKP